MGEMAAAPVSAKRQPFRLLLPGQACNRWHCKQEILVVHGEETAMLEGLDALGEAAEGVLPVAIGGGSAAALTVIARLAAPVGSTIHRHAPAIAGAAGAVFTGLVTRRLSGALAALLVGGTVWGTERLLEYQAQKLLPAAVTGG